MYQSNWTLSRPTWIVIGIALICQLEVSYAGNASLEYKLIHHLLAEYDVNILPLANRSNALDVTLDIAVNQILDLDSRSQTLLLSVWLRQYWRDWNLHWDPTDYGNITDINLYTSRMWHPDIVVYNRVLMDDIIDVHDIYSATITHEGDVTWLMPKIYQTSCNLNMRYFPWDKQVCNVKLGSWSYDGGKLNLLNKTNGADLTSYRENGEWEMEKAPVSRSVTTYTCCASPYISLNYYLHIRRKPLYYIINVLAPSCFIGVTAIIAFISPASSGEKIGLSITVLLASTVFLLVVDQVMPIQSDVIPMLGFFYVGLIILLASTTVMTVVIVSIHHKGEYGAEVPKWANIIFLKWAAKVFLCRSLEAKSQLSEEAPQEYVNQRGMEVPVQPIVRPNNAYRSTKSNISLDTRLPSSVLKFVNDRSKSFVALDKKEGNDDGSRRSTLDEKLQLLVNSLRVLELGRKQSEKEEENKLEWLHLSRVLDRVSSVFFLVFMTITVVVVFLTPVRVDQLVD